MSSGDKLLDISNESISPIHTKPIVNISLKRPKVMVVDDEPFIQLALGSLLDKLGCITDKASNGKQGIEMINRSAVDGQPYDIIFMDANMPVMNGYEATKLLRENRNITTPIVCVSAQDSLQHKDLCKESGMNDIISKPCTINKLKEILIKYDLM